MTEAGWAAPGGEPDGGGRPPVPQPYGAPVEPPPVVPPAGPHPYAGSPPPSAGAYPYAGPYPHAASYPSAGSYPYGTVPSQPVGGAPGYGPPPQWVQPGAGYRPPPVRPVPPEAFQPRVYAHLLRGPQHRWWRSLLSLGFGVLVAGITIVASGIFALVVLSLSSGSFDQAADRLEEDSFYAEPGGFLLNNLGLAALIPIAMLAVWLCHGWRPRWVSSVVPGIRWRWLLECTGWSVGYVAVLAGIGLLLGDTYEWKPEKHFWVLVAIVVLTQPLQAAGEEYGFRGLLTQAIGAWFRRGWVATVVGGLVTATLFALAHGSQSPWLFADRFFFGAVASYLVWRTGGLEAGIALHTVNNYFAIGAALGTGSLAESMTATDYPPLAAILDMVLMTAFAAVITWRAGRWKLQRVHDPALQPGGGPAGAAVGAGPWAAYAALAAAQVPAGQMAAGQVPAPVAGPPGWGPPTGPPVTGPGRDGG